MEPHSQLHRTAAIALLPPPPPHQSMGVPVACRSRTCFTVTVVGWPWASVLNLSSALSSSTAPACQRGRQTGGGLEWIKTRSGQQGQALPLPRPGIPCPHLESQLPLVLRQRSQQAQVALQEGRVCGRHLLARPGRRALHDALRLRVLELVARPAGAGGRGGALKGRRRAYNPYTLCMNWSIEGLSAQGTQKGVACCSAQCPQVPPVMCGSWQAPRPALAPPPPLGALWSHRMSVRPNQVSCTSKLSASRVHSTLTA